MLRVGHGRSAGAREDRRQPAHRLGLPLSRRAERRGHASVARRHRRGRAGRVRASGSRVRPRDDERMPRSADADAPVLSVAFALGKVDRAPIVAPRPPRLRRRSGRSSTSSSAPGRGGAATARRSTALLQEAERDYAEARGRRRALRRGADARSAGRGRRRLRAGRGARLPADAGRAQAGRASRDRRAALLLEGELQQRLHRHGRRDLPLVAVLPALQPAAARGAAAAGARVRRHAALAVPVRAARSRALPEGQRPGLRRRREDRREPDAGRGVRQHAADARRARRSWTATPISRASTGRRSRSGRSTSRARASTPRTSSRTDDFAGHLAHNANLSIKAIVVAGGYRQARRARSDATDDADRLRDRWRDALAVKWMDAAKDGEHFRLAFDQPGTWSQKYNLVWDALLGLRLFPATSRRRRSRSTRRSSSRSACRSTTAPTTPSSTGSSGPRRWPDSRADFEALVTPLYAFLDRDAGPRAAHRLVLHHHRPAARLPGPLGRRRRLRAPAAQPGHRQGLD